MELIANKTFQKKKINELEDTGVTETISSKTETKTSGTATRASGSSGTIVSDPIHV